MPDMTKTVSILATFVCTVTIVFFLSSTLTVPNDERLEPEIIKYSDEYGGFWVDYREVDVINYPVGPFRSTPAFSFQKFVTTGDPVLNKLYESLEPRLSTMSDWRKADYLCGFVYENIHYAEDRIWHGTNEYVQYASETILTGYGDCEDHSILLYNLYLLSGLDTTLAATSGHMFVTVYIDGERIYADPSNYRCIGPALIDGPVVWFEPIASAIIVLLMIAVLIAMEFLLVRINL